MFCHPQLLTQIANNTNVYGWMHAIEKKTYANSKGEWEETDKDKLLSFIALIIYM